MDAQLFQYHLLKDHSLSIKSHCLLCQRSTNGVYFCVISFIPFDCGSLLTVFSCLLQFYNLETLYFKVPVFSSSKSNFVFLQYCIGYYKTFAFPCKLYKQFVNIYKLLTRILSMIPMNLQIIMIRIDILRISINFNKLDFYFNLIRNIF